MKIKYCVPIIILSFIFLISCESGPKEARDYTHTRAGFKITAPAGWSKVSEDNEMFEFRSGSLRLIEVGGFDLGVDPYDLHSLSTDEFMGLLSQSTLDGLDGYCDEAKITNYVIQDQDETMWGGEPAFHVQAKGYSTEALTSMIVDIYAIVEKNSSRMYMFASQIEENAYEKTKIDINMMVASFHLIQ